MGSTLEVKGIKEFQKRLDQDKHNALKAAAIALNYGADRLRTRGKKAILKEVILKSGYVDKNLTVVNRAKPNHGRLYAIVQGRTRPTSLGRFDAVQKPNRGGVSVKVKASRKNMRKGFLMTLKGKGGTGNNRGLAIRLKKGEKVEGRSKPLYGKKDTGLYLLYGPSVDQVFRNLVRDSDTLLPDVLEDIEKEFNRQFERLST